MRLLLNLVDQSTGRVADLVKAIKSYTHMDQAPMQEVDVHEGLECTLTMLGHKLKNVTLVRAFDRSVPRITGLWRRTGHQVWTNLIDNAIDAVKGTGKICVGTSLEDNQVLVEIVDDGSGIPEEIPACIFEPFFTTKGLAPAPAWALISNRIVADNHGGEIEFESRPGETRFKVRLPVTRRP